MNTHCKPCLDTTATNESLHLSMLNLTSSTMMVVRPNWLPRYVERSKEVLLNTLGEEIDDWLKTHTELSSHTDPMSSLCQDP